MAVSIEIAPEGVSPKTLVERAVKRKAQAEREATRSGDSYERLDEVWCVFDRDQHPNVTEAKQQARANDIRVAFSNPAFELWLLLHKRDQRAHIERAVARKEFKKFFPKYDKEPPCEELRPFYDDAVGRARALCNWQRDRGMAEENPWTDVYLLTERLRHLDRDELLRRHRVS